MYSKNNWKHLHKGVTCKLCGNVSAQKKPHSNKRSNGCSQNLSNPQLFYCWRKHKLFFLDRQDQVLLTPKWSQIHCSLCFQTCLALIENPKQRWCKTFSLTYFLRYDGSLVCRALFPLN